MAAALTADSPRIDCPMCGQRVGVYSDRRIADHGTLGGGGECSASGQLVSWSTVVAADRAQATLKPSAMTFFSGARVEVDLGPGEYTYLTIDTATYTLTHSDVRELSRRLLAALDPRNK